MSHYGYLPHEYSYAIFLADDYDLYPWDSIIHNTTCKVVKYLKGSPGRGLLFRREYSLQLLGFTDAY